MLSAENKALIQTLYTEKNVSIRCIAKLVHVSRNAVRRQIREEGKARSDAGVFLKEHAIDVQELYLTCEMRCPPLRRRLKDAKSSLFRGGFQSFRVLHERVPQNGIIQQDFWHS